MRRYRASVLRGNGATSAIPGAPARTVRASDIVPPAATGIFDPNDAQVSVGFSNARVVVELLFPGAERLPALDFTRAEARLTVFDAGSGTAREVDLVAWPRYGLDAEKGKLVMTADFLLPPNTIPEEAEMQLVLSSSLRSDELRRRLSLDLRNVWLMGPTGAGKTQLAACLNALAKHGPFAQEFLQCRTRRRGVTPAVTGETFHARGIRFVELPGMQFDTETERLALFDRLAEVPPHLVLVVFDGHAGIVSTGGDGGRGLPAQVAALRTQMRGIADKVSELAAAESKRDGAGPGDGQKPQQLADIGAQIAWVFTKWGFVDPDDRAEKERELRAALGATDGERSFCVNAGCDRNTSRIEGAVELFDYIQSAVHRASSAGQADVFRFFRRAWFAAGVWVRRNVTPQHVAAVGVAAAAVAVAPPMGTMTEVVTFVVPALLRIFRIRLG
ncbi:hypothetical protein DFJ74DRAFT_689517 [Hyaloraphidium curvatum]|nr:hypothetical protein DFJ74DRAFT_689517 [Hyaloraphidium curvatum]